MASTLSPGSGSVESQIIGIRALIQRGDLASAHALTQHLIAEFPNRTDLSVLMADIQVASGNTAEAIRWYENALELDFDPGLMERLAALRSGMSQNPPLEEPPTGPVPLITSTPRHRPERQQAIALVVLGVLVLSLSIILIWSAVTGSRINKRVKPAEKSATLPQTEQIPTLPAVVTNGTTALNSPMAPQILPEPLSQYTGQPLPPNQPPAIPQATAKPRVPTTATETRVLKQMKLEKVTEGTSSSSEASYASDSWTGGGLLTLSAPRVATFAQLEIEVLTLVYRTALAAMRSDTQLQNLVIRVVAQDYETGAEGEDAILFRATCTRASVANWLNQDEKPTWEQLKNSFITSFWWDEAATSRFLQYHQTGGSNP